jgi:hypothetical protein
MKLLKKGLDFLIQNPIKNILIIAFIWLIINTFLFGLQLQTTIFPDAENYYGSSVELYQNFRGHCYRPVLFALISGFPLLFNVEKTIVFQWIIGLNLIFWFTSIILVFKICNHFISVKKAFVLTLIFVFSISNLFFVFHYLTESIFTLIFLAIIYFFLLYIKTKKYQYLVFSLAIMILSVIIKPMTTYLVPLGFVLFIPIFLKNIKNKYNLLLYFSILLIVIQLVGMKAQFGNFTISYIDKAAIHNYLLSKSYNYNIGKEYEQLNNPRAEFLLIQDPKIQKKIAEEDLKNQLKSNKINILKAFFNNLITNTDSNSSAIYFLENKNNFVFFDSFKSIFLKLTKIYNLQFIIVFLFFFSWYVFNFKTKKNTIITLTTILAFYTFFVSGISSDQGDRFHIVIYPLILICFSYFLANFKMKK